MQETPILHSTGKLIAFGVLVLFAIAGFFDWIVGPLLLRTFRTLVYVTETKRVVPAPRGRLQAVEEVTRGGFGTVRTTRVVLQEQSNGSSRVSIYQNRDSDFEPPMRWVGPELLVLCIPQGRVDYLANPRAHLSATNAIGQASVRFVYCAAGRNR